MVFKGTCLAGPITNFVECSEIHCTLIYFVHVLSGVVMAVLVSYFTYVGHESGR